MISKEQYTPESLPEDYSLGLRKIIVSMLTPELKTRPSLSQVLKEFLRLPELNESKIRFGKLGV